jgi:hypothetical protein
LVCTSSIHPCVQMRPPDGLSTWSRWGSLQSAHQESSLAASQADTLPRPFFEFADEVQARLRRHEGDGGCSAVSDVMASGAGRAFTLGRLPGLLCAQYCSRRGAPPRHLLRWQSCGGFYAREREVRGQHEMDAKLFLSVWSASCDTGVRTVRERRKGCPQGISAWP